jgi:predicted nucleic acid-binding protein
VTAYFDTSALVAAYVTEVHSPAVRRVLRRQGPIPFTPLHRLELRNAFELLVGRSLLSPSERDALDSQVQDDRQAGRLVDTAADWEAIFTRAGDLSIDHTKKHLTRSLDLLHVALALELECRSFVSGDRRQLTVARSVKLRPIDITRTRRAAPHQT